MPVIPRVRRRRPARRACDARPSNRKRAMDKRQLIDDIRKYNATARPRFLAQFDEAALRQYLDHLRDARERRARVMTWSRRGKRERVMV